MIATSGIGYLEREDSMRLSLREEEVERTEGGVACRALERSFEAQSKPAPPSVGSFSPAKRKSIVQVFQVRQAEG